MENLQNQGEDPKEEKLVELTEDEARSKVIEDYGLDETDQSELIDKLVVEKLDSHKKLSTAIRQKIDWRTKANSGEGRVEPPKPQVVNEDELFNKLDERLDKRELDSLEISDELKTEVQTYAKLKKIPIKTALKSDYIQFRKAEEDKKTKADEASLGGNRKNTTKKNYEEMKATDFDMKTEEGKAEFKKWEDHMRKTLG